MKKTRFSPGRPGRPRRGVALLLVMISLVVCSILTAGFLSSQGTSIGIARNERDSEKARGMAQSGIELCYWLVKNRSDWRTGMSPGTWLSNYAIGDGTVTVTAASADGTSSFINDTTKAVVLTSTGTANGRTYTLTATIGPTGGGTVFRGGNYMVGKITLGNDDHNGAAVIDSYNSSVGAYILSKGSNAVFGNSYTNSGALNVYNLSSFSGSFNMAKGANSGTAVYATWWSNAPSVISQATMPYTLGTVISPNLTGFTTQGSIGRGSGQGYLTVPGNYNSGTIGATLIPVAQQNITVSGVYHVTGDLAMSTNGVLNVQTGVNAVVIVDGNLTMGTNCSIKATGSGTLTMYVAGNVTLNNTAAVNFGGSTSAFTLLGTGNNSNFTMANTATLTGSVYAPNANFTMQNTTVMYGAIVAKSVTLKDTSAFHFDENLKSKQIDNITGGSAPLGVADYAVSIVGTSGVVSH